MKRFNHLMPQLCDFGHLYRSFKKARKGSHRSWASHEFFFHLEVELLRLRDELFSGSYSPGSFHYFEIFDPKQRTISVAPFRDRVVHHAIVGVLEPIFEPRFIYHSYATRKGKGTHRAVEQAQRFCRRYRWYFKTDIDQFFDSVDHDILLALVARKVKDAAFLRLVEKVIRNGGSDGKGLPIGNLTSQFFANVYLDPLDHFVKENLRAKGYLRYMDDFVLWGHRRSQLKQWRTAVADFLREKLLLSLKPAASFLNQRAHGLPFLALRIFPDLVRFQPHRLRRLQRRMAGKYAAFADGKLPEKKWLDSLQSSWAHLSAYDSLALRTPWAENFGQAARKARTG